MFEFTSRYAAIETAKHTCPDGRIVPYARRRFLPPAGRLTILATTAVADGARLDQVAAQAYGASEQFWQIADASDMMNPFEAMREVGRVLRVPLPQAPSASVPLAPFPTPDLSAGGPSAGAGR